MKNISYRKWPFFDNFLICFRKFDWKSVFPTSLKLRHTSLSSGICREFRTKCHQNSQKKCKIRCRKWKIGNSIFHSRKNVDDFWLKFWDWRTVQRSALCRSRRELSNEYLLAKIGVDTAENEPLEVWGKIQFIIHSPPWSSRQMVLCTTCFSGSW